MTQEKPQEPTLYHDPSLNVLALVEAAVKRLDDIQRCELKRVDDRLQDHISYTKELSAAESRRIDAIRAVDVSAVTIASDRANLTAATLAKQVVESAETLRSLVGTTAAAVASQLSVIQNQLSGRISELERSNSEHSGKTKMSMPIAIAVGTILGGLIAFLIQLVLLRLTK